MTAERAPIEPAISPRQVRRGLVISVVEGAFATVHIQLSGGLFLSGLALFLGARDLEIGLLGALPALLAPVGFAAALLVARTGNRRRVVVSAAAVGRALFLIPALFLLRGWPITMTALLMIIAAFNALIVIAGNAWTSWMSELVPRDRWGRYFGLRNTVVGIVGMITAYSGAELLDGFKARGQVGIGFGWVFLAAGIASMAAAVLLAVQPDVPMKPRILRLTDMISTPLADRGFRRLLAFVAFWNATAGVASPFFGVHMLGNLGMSYSQTALYGIIAGISGLVFQLVWGRAIDRFHPKPILQLNFIGASFLPLFWLVATPEFLLPIWLDSFLTGIFWTGVGAALFTMMLGSVTRDDAKESYIALFTTVVGISGFVSATAGGFFAELLGGLRIVIMGQTFINYHGLFAAAALSRFLSLVLLARVDDPGAPSARFTLAAISDYGLRRLTMGKELRLTAFRLNALAVTPPDRVKPTGSDRRRSGRATPHPPTPAPHRAEGGQEDSRVRDGSPAGEGSEGP